MNPASIAVVIPAVNEASVIERCLRSVFAAEPDEVIVCDGGSQDDTPAIAARMGARVIHSAPGRAVQQNRGAAIASSAFLVFLHADNWLDRDALRPIRNFHGSGRPIWGAMRQSIAATGMGYRLLETGNVLRVLLRGIPFGDQAIYVQRELFMRVGMFEEIPLMEDLRLASTLRQFARPRLLPGRVHVDDRRWKKMGVTRQTLRNWRLQWQHARGASPAALAALYRRHDQ